MKRFLFSLCVLTLLTVAAHDLRAQELVAVANGDAVDPKLTAAVSAMLDAGFQPTRVAADALEARYRRSIKELGAEHPYLDYAYSLALTKNLYSEEAQPLLESAAKSTSPVTLPAREELVRQKLRKQQYSAALEGLAELAEVVGKIPPEGRAGEDAARSANWSGTVLGYLEGAIGLEEVRSEARIIAAPIRSYLDEHYAAAFDKGRANVGVTYHNLGRQLIESLQAAEDQKAAVASDAQQKQSQLVDQQQQIEDGAQQLADVAKEDLSEVDSQIEALEKLLDASLKSEQAILVSEAQLRLEIASLRGQYNAARSAFSRPGNTIAFATMPDPRDIEGQITIRELQLTSLMNDYVLLLQSRDQLMRRGNALVNNRSALASTYGSRAGDIQKRMATLTKLQDQLNKATIRKLNVPVEKAPEVATVRRRMKDLATYEARSADDSAVRLKRLSNILVAEASEKAP